jgi:CreA protein
MTHCSITHRFTSHIVALAAVAALALPVQAETVGSVDTAFKLIGPDHKVVVEVFDDPRVGGVSCYLSRAKTGGLKGAIGLAEDTADSSVACRQVGPFAFKGKVPRQEEVFTERASIFFKHVRVVRMVDAKRNALVYLVYSDKLIEGSPKNSVTAVPVPATQPIPVQ